MIEAARVGDVKALRKLLASGANPDEKGKGGATPLFYAASGDHAQVAEILLAKGASVNTVDNKGRTALFANLNNDKDSLEILQLLILKGAAINHRDSFGMNALHLSVDVHGSHSKTKFLIENGIEINVQSAKEKDFALRIATSWGDKAAVQLLLERGSNPNLQRQDGTTALMEACLGKHLAIVKMLLDYGADPSLTNKEGQSAYDLVATDDSEIRSLFKSEGN